MKPFGSEVVSLLGVGAVIAAMSLEMPLSAFSFKASPDDDRRAKTDSSVTTFVTLDEQTEAAVIRRAKDTLRKGNAGSREYADLSFSELPEGVKAPVLSLDSRCRPPEPPPAEAGVSPYLPSSGAGVPEKIPLTAGEETLPFTREELLKID